MFKQEIADILTAYNKDLTNETDEKYAQGFWDFAGYLADGPDTESRQEAIYDALTELHRQLTKHV